MIIKEQVWIHKKTGQLYEWFEGCLGGVLAYEDITGSTDPITKDSPILFDDEYNVDDYEVLGEL